MRNKVGNRTNLFATDVQLQSSLSVAEFASPLQPQLPHTNVELNVNIGFKLRSNYVPNIE